MLLQMDEPQIFLESIVKMEVKEEPGTDNDESEEENLSWITSVKVEPRTDSDENEEENMSWITSEELKPPEAVWVKEEQEEEEELKPPEAVWVKEDLEEEPEEEDPPVLSSGDLHNAPVTIERREDSLSFSGEELKKKWKNIRDTYARYIKSTETGQAAICYKKWVWADLMEGFRPFFALAATSSSVSDIEFQGRSLRTNDKYIKNRYDVPLHSENYCTDKHDGPPHTEPEEVFLQVLKDSETTASTPSINIGMQPLQNSSIGISIQKRNNKKDRVGSEQSSVKELITYFQRRRQNTFDEIDFLFLAHAKTIKKFSPRRQVIVKIKIAQLIMEEELSHLDELASTKAPLASKSVINYNQNNPCVPNVT